MTGECRQPLLHTHVTRVAYSKREGWFCIRNGITMYKRREYDSNTKARHQADGLLIEFICESSAQCASNVFVGLLIVYSISISLR